MKLTHLLLVAALLIPGLSALASDKQTIKSQILQVATENMTNVENRAEVRAELEGLLADLLEVVPKATKETIVRHSPGSWQQIWADERDNSGPGAPAQDLSQIYQFVSTKGWAYNFGVRNINENVAVTFALGAVASVEENRQTTRIVSGFSRNSTLLTGESISKMATDIHLGQSEIFTPRELGEFPRGPIGAEGVLTIFYVDEDLKIGTAPNVYTGDSEMFVLERTDTVRR